MQPTYRGDGTPERTGSLSLEVPRLWGPDPDALQAGDQDPAVFCRLVVDALRPVLGLAGLVRGSGLKYVLARLMLKRHRATQMTVALCSLPSRPVCVGSWRWL